MLASNKVAGDPAIGHRKVLAVEYRDSAGHIQLATAEEGAAIDVDVLTTPSQPADGGEHEHLASTNTTETETAASAAAAEAKEEKEEVEAEQAAAGCVGVGEGAGVREPKQFAAELEVLAAMGFGGGCLAELLVKHAGSIQGVIEDLI
jgi:hypothetical protein